MSVDPEYQILCHFSGDDAAGHLIKAADRQIVDKQRSRCRIALGTGFLDAFAYGSSDPPGNRAFRLREPADGIQNRQFLTPVTVGNGMTKERFKFCIAYLCDLTAAVAGQRLFRWSL